jgi:hypothetical protein
MVSPGVSVRIGRARRKEGWRAGREVWNWGDAAPAVFTTVLCEKKEGEKKSGVSDAFLLPATESVTMGGGRQERRGESGGVEG